MSTESKKSTDSSDFLDRIVCFCASHIDSEKRLARFKLMLKSWKEQNLPTGDLSTWKRLAPLWISISYETTELETLTESVILKMTDVPMLILKNKSRKTQFQHYLQLNKRIQKEPGFESMSEKGIWVLFTDDDDTWHRDRLENYRYYVDLVEYMAKSQRKFINKIVNCLPNDQTGGQFCEYVHS